MNEIYKSSYKFITFPCYSPDLNPIELSWSKWKREVKRGGSISGEDDLVLRIANGAKLINAKDCFGWMKHTLSFYKKSYAKESFY